MSIGERASQGFFSFLTRNIISRIMGLISLFILTRELSPYDFGLVSFTEILMYFIAVFGSTGLNEFLLAYNKADFKEMIKSAFWFNMVLTVLMMVIFFIFIPLWSESMHDPRIVFLGFISGVTFFVTQLQIIPKTILSRNLDFKTIVKIQNPFIIIIPVAKIAAALGGMGVYSLIVPTLFFTPIQTLWFYRSVNWRLEWNLRVKRWKEIFHFSKHLIGNSLLTRLTDDGDKLILSSFLGLDTLGIYNMAYQLSSFVGLNVVSLTSSVLTSVLPKYRNDLPQMKAHFLTFTKVLAFFTFPIITLLAVFAEPLIMATQGEKWLSVVVPFQILSLYALIRSVTSSGGAVLNTLHLNKISFRRNLLYTPLHILSSVIFSYYFGIIGVAASVVVLRMTFGMIFMNEAMHAMGGKIMEFIRVLNTPFKIIILLIGPCMLLQYLVSFDSIYGQFLNLYDARIYNMMAIIYFASLFLAGIIFFITIVRIVFKKNIRDIAQFLSQTGSRTGNIFNRVFAIQP